MGSRAPLWVRIACLACMAGVAAGCSAWRHALGQATFPGRFTLVFLPLGVIGFVVVERYVHYSRAAWIAVTALIVGHLVFSVPALPDTIYDLHFLSSPFRVDHAVHVFAGGLVARLGAELVVRRWGTGIRPPTVAALAVLIALGLGGMKVTTDILSVGFQADNVADLVWNGVGALIAVSWSRFQHRWTDSGSYLDLKNPKE